mmetsp:Transcript_13733/g.43377  ORF Transcript_13733/g.43377 Transcript_13733/m.43377 type:complete len:1491 (+) Transcript_13733:119-4591(+)
MDGHRLGFDARHSVQEAFEDAALRRRRREVELKRLQVEDAKLELQRAQLQHSSRARSSRGRGVPVHKGYALPAGSGRGTTAKPGTARKQRRGQGSLERRREARAAAREAALAQNALSDDPFVRAAAQATLASSALLATAPPFEPAAVRQWQGQQGQTASRHLDLSPDPAVKRAGSTFHPLYSHVVADPPSLGERKLPADDFGPHADHVDSQMGSANWAGWTMICDMLNDAEPGKRASAVNTLRAMTNDAHTTQRFPAVVGSATTYDNGGDDLDAMLVDEARTDTPREMSLHEQQPGTPSDATPTADQQSLRQQLWEQRRLDAVAQREEACQALLEHGAVGQLVGLLKADEQVQTQIAATQVLCNVVTHAARQPEPTDAHASGTEALRSDLPSSAEPAAGRDEGEDEEQEIAPTSPVSDSRAHHGGQASVGGEECVKTIMEEADVVRPIIDLLESEEAMVRSSALGTVNEIAHASEEARHHFFQEPALLPHILNVVEQSVSAVPSPPIPSKEGRQGADHEDASAEYSDNEPAMPESNDDSSMTPEWTASSRPDNEADDGGCTEDSSQPKDDSDDSAKGNGTAVQAAENVATAHYAATESSALADHTQAVGVLNLMLSEERGESAQRVREAIATRPRVIESIVNVATLAPPPQSEEAAFLNPGIYLSSSADVHEAEASRAANDTLTALSGGSRNAAATAVVHVLGQRRNGDPEWQENPPNAQTTPPYEVLDRALSRDADSGDEGRDARYRGNEGDVEHAEKASYEIDEHETLNASAASEAATTYEQFRLRQRRQLGAMAALRNLVTSPDPTAGDEQEQPLGESSLRAVRNAGGVDAVVSILGQDDPCAQASASLTLMAMVKADDEANRLAKRAKKRTVDGSSGESSDHGATDCDSVDTFMQPALDTQVQPGGETPADECEALSTSEVGCEEGDAAAPLVQCDTATTVGVNHNEGYADGSFAGNQLPVEGDGSSLRAEIAENELAIPRLVSVLSRGKEQPGAAVQAAATLAAILEESDPSSHSDENEDPVPQEVVSPKASPENESFPNRPELDSGTIEAHQAQLGSDPAVVLIQHDDDEASSWKPGRGESGRPALESNRAQHKPKVEHHSVIKLQLKKAIEADSSVIPAVVDLLREWMESGSGANTSARHLAETLRAMAESDLVNQMRIRDAGGVRPLMAVLTQAQEDVITSATSHVAPLAVGESAYRTDETVRFGQPGLADKFDHPEDASQTTNTSQPVRSDDACQEAQFVATFPANIDSDPSSRERPLSTVKLLGEAWLATKLPLSSDTAVVPSERERHDASVQEPPEGARALAASTDRRSSVDDIAVHSHNSANFDYGSNHKRITSQPMGFRRWFTTHSILATMNERADAAKQDLAKINAMLAALQQEENDLLVLMDGQGSNDAEGPSSSTVPTDHRGANEQTLEQYYLLRHEIDYVERIQRDLEQECACRSSMKSVSLDVEGVETEANAKAELHLLNSTFQLLGKMRIQ